MFILKASKAFFFFFFLNIKPPSIPESNLYFVETLFFFVYEHMTHSLAHYINRMQRVYFYHYKSHYTVFIIILHTASLLWQARRILQFIYYGVLAIYEIKTRTSLYYVYKIYARFYRGFFGVQRKKKELYNIIEAPTFMFHK